MVFKLGLDKDLELLPEKGAENSSSSIDQREGQAPRSDGLLKEEDLERLEHYLLTLKTEMVPYGLHTFGVSPFGEGLAETAAAIAEKNMAGPASFLVGKKEPVTAKENLTDKPGEIPGEKSGEKTAKFYEKQLAACGPSEMAGLINGLSGGYIPSGAGNDPIRNPESLPTGKNFYGFDPEKTPSKEAWENGKKAARDIIETYQKKHGGKYPEQVGVILWSVETIRDEGTNVSTALYLMGIAPVWDHRDKIKGLAPIPGVLSPEIVEKFTLAIERATGMSLEKQVEDRARMIEAMAKSSNKAQPDITGANISQKDNRNSGDSEKALSEKKVSENKPSQPDKIKEVSDVVEGYKMEKIKSEDRETQVTTSGVQWFAALFILFIIGLFVIGSRIRRG